MLMSQLQNDNSTADQSIFAWLSNASISLHETYIKIAMRTGASEGEKFDFH